MFKLYRQVLDQIGQQLEKTSQIDEQHVRENLRLTLEERAQNSEPADGPAVFTIDRSGQVRTLNGHAALLLNIEVGQRVEGNFCTPNLMQFVNDEGRAPGIAQCSTSQSNFALFTVRRQADGQRFQFREISPAFSPLLHQPFEDIYGLTPAELHILARLVKGQDAPAIADHTQRKLSTVRQHIKAILQKTNCKTKDQLIGMASYASASLSQIADQQNQNENELLLNRLTIDGTSIPYRRFGMKGGVPIVLFHGAFFGIAPHPNTRLAAHHIGLDVMAIERPGYGENPIEGGEDPVAIATAQTKKLMQHLGWSKAILMGHDIGTHFAFAFARAEPKLCAGIVCGATTPPMRDLSSTTHMPRLHRVNAWAAQKMPEMMQWIVNVGIAQIDKKGIGIIPNLLFADAQFDRDYLLERHHLSALEQSFELVKSQKAAGFTDDMRITNLNWWDWLDDIHVPVELFHGMRSQTVAQSAVEEMAGRLKNGHVTLIQNGGHALPFSHAHEMMRAANAIFLTQQNKG